MAENWGGEKRHLKPVDPPTLTGGKQVGASELGKNKTIPGYSAKNFYVSGSDDKGRSGTVRVSPGKTTGRTLMVPRYIAAQINQLVEDDATPYRYQQDFIRDAIVHRLHYLQQFRKDDPIWGTFARMSEVEKSRAEAQQQAEHVERLEEALNEACTEGDKQFYDEILKEAKQIERALRDPYKGRLSVVIKKYARPK